MSKKILISTALILGLCSISMAQVSLKGIFGINFSNLSENPEGTEITGLAGYQFGGSILIGDKFYIEPGFQMVRNSRNFKYTNEGDYEFKVTEKWIKIPIHVGYHIIGSRGDKVSLRLFGGPAASFLGEFTSDEEIETLFENDLESARWAIDGGIGLDILFLFAEFNYEYSLNEYSKLDGFDAKHGAYVFNVGARIDF